MVKEGIVQVSGMDVTSDTYVELKGPHTYKGVASWNWNYC